MKKNALLLFALFSPFLSYAQYAIKGKVVDENEKALSHVAIRLMEEDSVFVRGGN